MNGSPITTQNSTESPGGRVSQSPALKVNRPTMPAAFIEREYNNRLLVPEFPEYLERWVKESETVRSIWPCTTHRFGAQAMATLDLFAARSATALLIFIHGGYWRSLSKDAFSFIVRPFQANKISVAVLNYDLCPQNTVAGILDQVVAAMHYLDRQPNIPKRWLVAGHSAGGHLTAALWTPLAKLAPQVRDHILGGMTISGVHDLDPMVDFSINTELRLNREEAHRMSPIAYAPRLTAPLIVAVGARESNEFLRQSQVLHAAWPSVCQSPNAGLIVAADRHHFSVVEALEDPGHVMFRRLAGLVS